MIYVILISAVIEVAAVVLAYRAGRRSALRIQPPDYVDLRNLEELRKRRDR